MVFAFLDAWMGVGMFAEGGMRWFLEYLLFLFMGRWT